HFDESFSEACDRFKDLLRACPHHGLSELHQLDTFYNALNSKDQDSLNFTAGVSMNTSTFGISPDVAELKDMVKALLLDKKSQNQSHAPVKAVEESCVVENKPEATKDTVQPTNNRSTEDVQPQVVQSKTLVLNSELVTSPIFEPIIALVSALKPNPKPSITSPIFEPVIALVSALKPNPKSSIPYPSRRNDERNREKANNQIEKFYKIFKDIKKLSEMARTPLNKHCSAVLLKKLPEKLGDPGKFPIPCDFPSMAECLALADLSASIYLMPFSVWKRLSLPNLTPMYMTLELANSSISRLVGVAEDIYVKVGQLTLRIRKEAITFNLGQTSRYSANYSDMTAKRIYVIDMACEEYSQEVQGFSDVISSGNPTPYYDLIISTTSLTLTPFGNIDFLLEEVDAFLAIEDDLILLKVYQPYLDPEGDIFLLEAFLNDDPSLPPLTQGNYLLKFDLSVEEKTALITILKSHKRAIAWKLSDIKGIDPEFCTHEILMEEDFEPVVQHQRRVNPKILDVIKQEVIKLLEARLIYPIYDSPWVCLVHCVPKKGGFTIVENEIMSKF
nr:hypothetical protein [Tanacetum cinerariifolium]